MDARKVGLEKITSNRARMLADMGVQVWFARSPAGTALGDMEPALATESLATESVEIEAGQIEAGEIETGEIEAGEIERVTAQAAVEAAAPARENEQLTAPDVEPAHVQADPIALHWAKGQAGLLLFAAQPDEALEIMAADIVRALDWQYFIRESSNSQEGTGSKERTGSKEGRGSKAGKESKENKESEENKEQQASATPVLGDFKWPQLLSSTGTPARSLQALLSKHLPQTGWLALTDDIAQQVAPWLKLAPAIDVYNLVDVRSALDEPDIKRVLWQQISNP